MVYLVFLPTILFASCFPSSFFKQRRHSQLLLLMYKKSCDISLLKVFPRNTRRSTRIAFKTANFESSLYKHSPYFVRAKLLDSMPEDDLGAPDLLRLKLGLKG